jgi:flagellar biosynthetic protein FliR
MPEGLLLDTATGLPGLELQRLMEMVLIFFLSTLRVGALLISAPFFGAASIPLQVRIMISVVLGVFMSTIVDVPDTSTLPFLSMINVVLGEILIGLAAGLMLSTLFAAVALAGEKIAASGGLGFAAQIDPMSGGQTPVISQFLTLFLIVIFLSLDGHLLVLAGIRTSYNIVPIGGPVAVTALTTANLDAAGDMFAIASRIMLPVASILLLTNIAVGVITRSAPQLNLFSFGFPMTLLAVFVSLYVTTTALGFAAGDLVRFSLESLEGLFLGMVDG